LIREAADLDFEYPVPLSEVARTYDEIGPTGLSLQVGGRQLDLYLADERHLFLVYASQDQVLYGIGDLAHGDILAHLFGLVLELYPSSVF